MRSVAASSLDSAPRSDGLRDTLVRLLGWRALILQQDVPTWDRWKWVRRHLIPGPYRTLDAGCGSGGFSIYAGVRGNEVVGLSFDEAANAHAARRATRLGVSGVRFRSEDLRELGLLEGELGSFDQILCLETIEHIQNDRKLVAEMAAMLRPGGRLLLSTPTAEHHPLVGEALSVVEDGGHVRWGYTLGALRKLFESVGLTLLTEEYLSGVVSQQITNLSRRLERVVGARGAWVVTAPLRLLLPLDGLLTRLTRTPWLAIAVVGVKP